jgi:hypothetical protein
MDSCMASELLGRDAKDAGIEVARAGPTYYEREEEAVAG